MKQNWKKIIADPSLWVLLGVNIFLVYEYEHSPEIFTTLIWLYWSQSVLFGFFTYLTMKAVINANIKAGIAVERSANGVSVDEASAWGFKMIFSLFHIVYIVFLATMKKSGPFDVAFYWKFLLAFFVFQLLSFIRHKTNHSQPGISVTNIFKVAFIRVLPMHLCILIPAFLNISNLTVFLVLKVICDVLMHIYSSDAFSRNEAMSYSTTMNINSTFSN